MTTPWHLSIPSLSIELFNCFLSQSQHLSTARWIDRESFCPLDSSSTATLIHRAWFAVDTSGHLLDSWICRAFKAQHLSTPTYLSRFTEPLYIHSAWSVLHFPRSLSIALNRFTSQTHFSLSKLHSQEIFSLDQVFPHLVRVLIFLFHAFSSFIT